MKSCRLPAISIYQARERSQSKKSIASSNCFCVLAKVLFRSPPNPLGRKPPVPFAPGIERVFEVAILETLVLIDHESLSFRLSKHLGQERIVSGFHAEGLLHGFCQFPILAGIQYIVHHAFVIPDPFRFGNHRID